MLPLADDNRILGMLGFALVCDAFPPALRRLQSAKPRVCTRVTGNPSKVASSRRRRLLLMGDSKCDADAAPDEFEVHGAGLDERTLSAEKRREHAHRDTRHVFAIVIKAMGGPMNNLRDVIDNRVAHQLSAIGVVLLLLGIHQVNCCVIAGISQILDELVLL